MNDHYPRLRRQNPAYGTLWSFPPRSFFFWPLFFILLSSEIASANFISLIVEPRIEFFTDGYEIALRGEVYVKNRGDEVAPGVIPKLSLGPLDWIGSSENIPAGSQFKWLAERRRAGVNPLQGRYPLIVRTFYSDSNGYPFSSVDVFPVTYGRLPTRQFDPIALKVSTAQKTADDFIIAVQIINHSDERRTLNLSLNAPSEIENQLPMMNIVVDPKGFRVEEFFLRNKTGLPGSTYSIQVVADWINDNMADFESIPASIAIKKAKYGFRWLVAGCLGSILAALAVLGLKSA